MSLQLHDEEKNEIIAKIIDEIRKKVPKSAAENVIEFVRQFYGTTSVEDLKDRNIIDLYGSILSFWNFIEKREPNETKVRVYNPHYEQHGWQSTHTIVEVIMPDSPFLVESISMEINRLGFTIHFIANMGNLHIKRNTEHQVTQVLPAGATATDAKDEAAIYLEIDRQTDAKTLKHIKARTDRILQDVRNAVVDWSQMKRYAEEALGQLRKVSIPEQKAELEESCAFLDWIIDNHFTFLGYRYYAYSEENSEKMLKLTSASSLGILRNEAEDHYIAKHFNSKSPELERFHKNPYALTLAKTDMRSTVHRPTYMDFIGIKKFSEKNKIVGEYRFFGLYTASAYNKSPHEIPWLRLKVSMALTNSGINPKSHAGKTLQNILETLPRDDLFQASVDELLKLTLGIYQLQERQRIRLFANVYDRFVSCLVYMPRERFSTELRQGMQVILSKALHSDEINYSTRFTDSPLARIHFVAKIDPAQSRQFDFKEIEHRLIEIGRLWQDELRDSLLEYHGEERGNALMQAYGRAFPSSYRETFSARTAVFDIRHLEKVVAGDPLEMNFYRPVDDTSGVLRLKVYQLKNSMPLSDVLPILENMGLRVMSERPYQITLSDDTIAWINDFGMYYDHSTEVDVAAIKEIFQDAFENIWFGRAEDDGFNRLVLGIGLSWREISVLRAYAKYLRQTGFTFSQSYIEETLAHYPHIARNLMALFHYRFDPKWISKAEKEIEKISAQLDVDLDAVVNLDEDRILRRYFDIIKSTLRTNFFQLTGAHHHKEYLSFKLNPQTIPDLPSPRPKYEIFVYSPRFEAVHLRMAAVARGGIRWSDRREDFRTEILGLMKAQQVKNAVIVPAGAKGGFVLKALPPDANRETIQAEGVACYQNFIRGLLDITDNLQNGKIVPPAHVVRYDGDDPYLVVAADKGTATFSDIANEISLQYGFWLGDAFASGGSTGYDHKKMGITARGAWESVKRHFRELGTNIQTTDFTVIGIGDMAGDVFGNGLLLSRHIKLVAAFNHQHIFLDPNPDPEVSFKERERMFNLPRSSWEDYNASLISKGGGIYKRSDKSIKLSPEIKKLLDLKQDIIVPNDLIRAILKAPIDLLWNGGIGTFVKAVTETHANAGDRTNDGIRINAQELQCKVVGEGGNLGFTQAARKEYSLNGGKIYADFIDNSGGVDCSDHEVNIKILLDSIVANGDMTIKQRNELLAQMTDEVGKLVLETNYRTTQAIALAQSQAPIQVELHARYIEHLVSTDRINREEWDLPDEKTLKERALTKHQGLSTPSLGVLSAYTKTFTKNEILGSDLPEDPSLSIMIEKEFPLPLRQKYRAQMEQHSLRREIIATQLVNKMINEMGFTFIYRLNDETGASTPAIVRAYTVARAVFDLNNVWEQIEALDNKVPAAVQLEMMLQVIRIVRRGTRWFLRNRRMHLDISVATQQFKPGVLALCEALPNILPGRELEFYQKMLTHYEGLGVPQSLACLLASARALFSALDIVEAANSYHFNVTDVASLYFALGDKLELGWMRGQVIERVVENHWESLSREALRDDLDWQQRQLTISVLAQENGASHSKEEKFKSWLHKYHTLVERWHYMLSELRASTSLNFTMFFVATRELLDLTQTCFQAVDNYHNTQSPSETASEDEQKKNPKDKKTKAA